MLLIDALQEEAAHVETPEAEGVCLAWLIDERRGAPHFAMRRFRIEPEGFTPLHRHEWEHEVYVLSGAGVLVTEEGDHPLEPDSAVLVGPGEKHQFRCTGTEPLEFLCLVPNGPATERG
jgi:quercetin dioxygenase-like cupin family protein